MATNRTPAGDDARSDNARLPPARWLAAALCVMYGFAKLTVRSSPSSTLNRAYWVTFRRADGSDERHHFEVDHHGVVRIWQTWLSKGALIMQGRIADDGQLALDTVGGTGEHRVILRRDREAQ